MLCTVAKDLSGKLLEYDCLPSTGIYRDKIQYLWPLNGFMELLPVIVKPVESSTFLCGGCTWCIVLQLYEERNEKFLTIRLKNFETENNIFASCKLCLLNNKNEEKCEVSFDPTFYNDTVFKDKKFCSLKNLIVPDCELLTDGVLRICCCLTVFNLITGFNILKPDSSIKNAVASLLESNLLSDFTIKTPTKEFKVHKIILAMRSPVFAAMMKDHTQEGISNLVEINDIDPFVVEALIIYLYTDNISSLLNIIEDLFEVADKYSIDPLKLICEQAMINTVNNENVLRRFALADTHSCDKLKDICAKLICNSFQLITKTPEWINFIVNYPHLVKDIFP